MARGNGKNKKLNAGKIPSLSDNPKFKPEKLKLAGMNDEIKQIDTEISNIPAPGNNDGDRVETYLNTGELVDMQESHAEKKARLLDRKKIIMAARNLQHEKVEAVRREVSAEINEEAMPEWLAMLEEEEKMLFALHDKAVKRMELRQELSNAGIIITLPDILFPGINVVHNWVGRLDAHETQKNRIGLN